MLQGLDVESQKDGLHMNTYKTNRHDKQPQKINNYRREVDRICGQSCVLRKTGRYPLKKTGTKMKYTEELTDFCIHGF